jgi:hypothetical protein
MGGATRILNKHPLLTFAHNLNIEKVSLIRQGTWIANLFRIKQNMSI